MLSRQVEHLPLKYEVENFYHLQRWVNGCMGGIARARKKSGGWVDGWMGGWVDGWVGGREQNPVLMIVHSSQKLAM